jgi:phosphatidylglycerol:prolipoprotein diacylglycerol transferase
MLLQLLLWISVDPDPIVFRIPFLNHPIAWYGVIFSSAFYVGYKLFIWIYSRELLKTISIPKKYANVNVTNYFSLTKDQSKLYKFFEKRVGNKEALSLVKKQFYLEQTYPKEMSSISTKAVKFADSALLYMILATVIGARLGHILFYEPVLDYLYSPILILKTWEGGLASHGGIIAILFSAYLFVKKSKGISYLGFMDLVCIPTMFVCAWIRIGNFINQEILGAPTTYIWGVIFKHPADGALAVPRHPMPLYEFILYMGVFTLLFYLWQKNFSRRREGLLLSLSILISFSVRFFLEFLKIPQSIYDHELSLQMGQVLSLPMIAIGLLLFIKARKEKDYLDKKVSER